MRLRRRFCSKSANRISRPADYTKNTDFARLAAARCTTWIQPRMQFCTRFDSPAELARKGWVLHHFLCDFGVEGACRRWKSSYEISLNRDRFLCYFLTVQ